MFLWWLSLLPLPHNSTTHSKALDSKICKHEVVQWRLSRQRPAQKQSSALLEMTAPEGRQRTAARDEPRRNCHPLLTPTSEGGLMKTPQFGPAASDDAVGVHPQHRDTAQGLEGTQRLPGSPSHGKLHGKSWTSSLVLNFQKPFCHLHILINNSYFYESLSNSKSQMSQCLHLNIGASHLSKQSHLCLWEGCGKHVI